MAAPINDEFFDKAVALSIASLDFAVSELQESHSQYADKIETLDQEYEEVEDIDKFKELNKQLIQLTNDIFTKEKLLSENKEVYVNLHEAIYINQYLETLLADANADGVNEQDAVAFLEDNFRATVNEILSVKDINKTLDDQMIKILEVIAKEKNIKDINEGISIVLSSMVRSKDDINNIFDLVVKADAIESFLFFLEENK